jgi:HEAT repeats
MRTAPLALAFALVSVAAFAVPPQVSHGRVDPLGGGGSLSARVQSIGSGWVGWSIPPRDSRSIICSCRLDSDNINIRSNDDDLRVAVDHHDLFVHLTDHAVDRVRVFSPACTLDASGQTIYWVEAVAPAEGIAFLRTIATGTSPRARNQALLALSLHAGATDTLIDIARHGDHELRGKALFWLSQEAGEKAVAALRGAVDDPDDEIRGKAVFGISQLPNDESIPMLIELTRHHSATVRKKALFWLGQKNDPRALDAIAEILQR